MQKAQLYFLSPIFSVPGGCRRKFSARMDLFTSNVCGNERTGRESDHSRRFFVSVLLGLPAPSRWAGIFLLDDVMRTRTYRRVDDVMFLTEKVTSCL